MEEASELEFLSWFYQHADFGPADGDVRRMLHTAFERKTKKQVPKDYRYEDEE